MAIDPPYLWCPEGGDVLLSPVEADAWFARLEALLERTLSPWERGG